VTRLQEKEFFRLVVDWFVCRLALLGHGSCRPGQHYDSVSWMLGELATYGELHLLLKEIQSGSHT